MDIKGRSLFRMFLFSSVTASLLASYGSHAQNGVGVNTSTPSSSFEDNGSFGKVVTTVTGNTTLDDTHSTVICNNGGSTITITLPAASTCSRRIYEIKRNNSSTANVTISGTIDGASNYVLTQASQSITLFSDGTNWWSRDGSTLGWGLLGNSGTASATNFIGTTDAIDFVVRTNNSERMRVQSGGNVGIGTTSPGSKLEVVSNAGGANTITSINTNASGYSSVDFKDNGSSLKYTVGYSNASAANFAGKAYQNTYGSDYVLSRNAPNTDFYMIGSSGNIGIGTSSPQQNLSVQNGMNIDQANSNNGSLSNGLTFGSSSAAGIASKRTGGGNQNGLDFYTGSTNRMAILSTGNVGINTSTPNSNLEVNGSFAANVSTTSGVTLDATHYIVVVTSGTVTLPTAAAGNNKRIYHIANKTAGAITIGSYTNMSNVAATTIPAGVGISVVSNGSSWIQFR